jgi:outer membrane protein assembly factor BamE (lipoprotein component of BamABCDE complex)
MKVFCVVVLISFCSGCIAMGTKVSESQLDTLTRGVTTYSEVVQALGTPTSAMLRPDGSRQATYTYTQSQARVANYIPVVGAFLQGGDTEQTTVTLEFNTKSVLTAYWATQGKLGVGTGFTSGARQ